ncbi:hypothetical protein EJF18_20187 [Clavispora lusitaniae]|uniref:Uncharacterized protein n=1 Tax=Clavispora lusitaniae TaxID=36911 RepID=A0ACD0WGI2_CLALS|nr:hypothetical protein EJF14_20187 [Clavispora lusitaniae]QFZ31956.1 hypothetical protein EJF16_20187 [Clavispora lusitaniae]QFZ37625.1 hypothetical protein EJF15_20187 [Clavispora lusitaniae]QFZ43309.1 hypothetical protein EJF18_20187 [Clavispora lusitaniae]QFZ48985.1 hypothetical protein EJF17_20187 [Clavispora lusitaniae]
MTLEPKHYVYIVLFVALAVAYVLKPQRKVKKPVVSNKNRVPGTWTPESFKTPVPRPYPHWDAQKTRPLPYRAFKHKYNITMGIRNMEWDSWIELDNEWMKFHQEKLDRLKEKGDEVHGTYPEARDAAFELLDEFWSYLPNRYPTLFRQLDSGLENLLTGERFIFRNCNRDEIKEDPMVMAALMVQDDLAIMVEGSDGVYYLKAGAIILPGFWRFKDKVGMPLHAIHTSGDVPKYQEKLHGGMAKFFTRLTCDKPVIRNNYFIQTDSDLGWSSSIGDEKSEVVGWNTAKPAVKPEQLYYRSERQSLRRLPKTGAVVFTIRTYFVPMAELVEEPHVPRRLLNAVESWSDDVREYRGYEKFKDVLLPYLQEKAEQQEKRGYVPETEPSVYPF